MTKTFSVLLTGVFMSTYLVDASAESNANVYIGFGLSSLALDGERVPGVPTRSPGHTPKVGSLILGYQFNDHWSLDLSLGTDFSNNVNTDQFSVNGYRFFGTKNWKPYISAGLSSFSIDDSPFNRTEQIQAGVGLSGALSNNLEMRVGYQHFFELDDSSFNDDAVMVSLNWHFRKPRAATVAKIAAQPESVPVKKAVMKSFELQVQFEFDKSTITESYVPQIEEAAKILNANPDISIIVEGHTSSEGTEQYNQGLSERRAEAVSLKFIQDYAISKERVRSVGYGETRPVADNSTAAGREKNRRAIAVILRKRKVAE